MNPEIRAISLTRVPFSSRVWGTLGDSPYVLDGLLEHQTSLNPKELMTDTAGYSDVFPPELRSSSLKNLQLTNNTRDVHLEGNQTAVSKRYH